MRVRAVETARHPDPYGNAVLLASEEGTRFSYDVCIANGGGRAHLDFAGVHRVSLGWPNDEALGGHRLANRGLRAYTVQEVVPSDWIAEIEEGNRGHPNHMPTLFEGLRHVIIPLKDETFECVYRDVSITYENGVQP